MNLTLEKIAGLVDGKLEGEGSVSISGVAGLEEAKPGDISFLRDEKNIDALSRSQAGAIFVTPGMSKKLGGRKNYIEVKNPMTALTVLLSVIADEKSPRKTGVHPQASVAKTATIGKDVYIGPFAVVEDGASIGDNVIIDAQVYVGPRTTIGSETHLYPQVIIREDSQIGQRCILHGGAVIGSDGFGFFYANGKHNKIPHIGTVMIEDDVEIGACTTIDRAMMGVTKIGRGSKIDNLVQIAHNVEVGPNSILVAQVGVAGSSKLEEGVVLGGQVGVADHVRIGRGAQVAAQSGIKDDVPPGSVLFGTPAQPIHDAFRQLALVRRLPEMFKKIGKSKSNEKVSA